jgi:hypothetical protein
MISVRNHRLLLNGNEGEQRVKSKEQGPGSALKAMGGLRWVQVLFILAFLSACSPKRAPVPQGNPPVVVEPPKEIPLPPAPPKKRESSMALVLPFELDKISTRGIQQRDITRSALAVDFYQGFKMALDSLAKQGYDFKLQVLDSRDNASRATSLAKSLQVQSSDIVIGPVFPEEIGPFGTAADLKEKLQVSPLAAGMPNQFNNSKLVTLNNPIDQHAQKLADFINRHYPPGSANIFIVNPRKTEDERFAGFVRRYLSSLSRSQLAYTEMLNTSDIEGKLSRTKPNVVIVTTPEKDVITGIINKLYQLNQSSYKIEVFGHPGWVKLQSLDANKLQRLNTRVTSSYFINYKSPQVTHFISSYKSKYHLEPSEFAYHGFDTGYLFGSLLAKYGKDYARHLQDMKFDGLHNDSKFSYIAGSGYVNNNLMMLRYRNFALELEE